MILLLVLVLLFLLMLLLSNGRSYDLPGGEVVPPELLEPGILVSFNCPTAPSDLSEGCVAALQFAGFAIDLRV